MKHHKAAIRMVGFNKEGFVIQIYEFINSYGNKRCFKRHMKSDPECVRITIEKITHIN